jgi:hypothetical protein
MFFYRKSLGKKTAAELRTKTRRNYFTFIYRLSMIDEVFLPKQKVNTLLVIVVMPFSLDLLGTDKWHKPAIIVHLLQWPLLHRPLHLAAVVVFSDSRILKSPRPMKKIEFTSHSNDTQQLAEENIYICRPW